MDPELATQWRAKWEKRLVGEMRDRTCDREMGEEIGWLVSPMLNGCCYGYKATGDTKYIDQLIDWADAVIKRALKEPDGCLGWPKQGGTSTNSFGTDWYTDNILGEAMFLRPLVLTAGDILTTPALKEKYGDKAKEYLKLSEKIFEKWDSRGAWRETKEGGLWVVTPFGLDKDKNKWTDGYDRRKTDGFSLPANKQNLVAMWLIAMHDVTGKKVYRERAEKWWRVMKARIKPTHEGKYCQWNYWDIGGPWDLKEDRQPRHWVGVHPKGGYYSVDVEAMVVAYEHKLVFTRADIDRLIATNRDFMWNREVKGARFGRIDGEKPDPRWPDGGGVLWSSLAPYDESLRKVFEANHDPASWGGLAATPEYLARFAELGRK